jgi:hypothetical protein
MVRDHRIETFDFLSGGLTGANFDNSSWRSLNGLLIGVQVKENNWAATGSLFVTISGLGYPVWSMISGTNTGNVSASGTYYPVAYANNQTNLSLSGTAPTISEIPLFGNIRLVGSGLGASKSGLGVTLVYKMG